MDIRMLVNKKNVLNKGFVPKNLVDTNTRYNVDRIDSKHRVFMVKEAFDAFQDLREVTLKEVNIDLEIESAYRSYKYQKLVLEHELNKNGNNAYSYVALPGTSEHQTGLAIDFVYYENGRIVDVIDCEQSAMKWLYSNCCEYGFILRYPEDKTEITGYMFEPWHLRYVGKELAKYLYENKLVLEEYWDLLV